MRGRMALVACALAVGTITAAAAPVPAGPAQGEARQLVVTRLPLPGNADVGVGLDINDRGQVVGQVTEIREVPERPDRPELIGRPAVWDRGRLVDLGPEVAERRGSARLINDLGQVALRIDDHGAIWHRGRLTEIAPDAASSEVYALNERGEALVYVEHADGSYVFGLWRDGALTEIGSPLGPDVPGLPRVLSDGGHVGVESRTPGCDQFTAPCPAHLWYRGAYTEFPAGQFHDTGADLINRWGQVVGLAPGGDAPRGAIRDRRGAVVSTFGCPADAHDDVPRPEAINDRGQVVGECTVLDGEDPRGRVVLWDGGEPRWLPTPGRSSFARTLNERGDVVGESDAGPVLWSGEEVFELGRSASARALNDRGQVSGSHDNQPVVWQLRAGGRS